MTRETHGASSEVWTRIYLVEDHYKNLIMPRRFIKVTPLNPERGDMWSSVVTGVGNDSPGARHKHAVCHCYPHVYILGGRQGNVPLKDFWIYDLATRTWRQECEDKGSRPPSLQQHTMVCSQGKILVFGGELCMSNETPLWIYEIQRRQWRKWQRPLEDEDGRPLRRPGGLKREGGHVGPEGRKGHTAIICDDQMLIYGGYRDLRGSTSEMWSFNIKDETWHQVSMRGDQPSPRHSHTAVFHDNHIWVYGGMTDLVERNDFWKYDITLRCWTQIKSRPNPGLLHSHVAVKLHSSIIIFGGERQGEILNDLWRYHFATGIWEKLSPCGLKPQPRTQLCAVVGPSHASKHFRLATGYSSLGGASSSSGSSSSSSGYGSAKSSEIMRMRKSNFEFSGGRGFVETSDMQNQRNDNRRSHFNDSRTGCGYSDCASDEDDSDNDSIDPHRLRSLIQRNCASHQPANLKLSISKISQLNLSHLGNYYNYSVLSNDSTESIVDASLSSTCESVNSKLVKSQSIHGIKDEDTWAVKTGFPRDNVSVPNFVDILNKNDRNLPTASVKLINVLPANGSSFESCLEDDHNELFSSINGKLALTGFENSEFTDTSIDENLMNFACTESSISSSVFNNSSFSNPNYTGFDPDKAGGFLSQDYWRKGALDLESIRHKEFAELLRTPPDSGIGLGVEMERRTPVDCSMAALEDFVSLDNKTVRFIKNRENEDIMNSRTKFVAHSPGATDDTSNRKSACNTSRVTFSTDPVQNSSTKRDHKGYSSGDRNPNNRRLNPFLKKDPVPEPEGPDAMYLFGGKEIDQMTVFKRPISIWKLDLPY